MLSSTFEPGFILDRSWSCLVLLWNLANSGIRERRFLWVLSSAIPIVQFSSSHVFVRFSSYLILGCYCNCFCACWSRHFGFESYIVHTKHVFVEVVRSSTKCNLPEHVLKPQSEFSFPNGRDDWVTQQAEEKYRWSRLEENTTKMPTR